MATLEELRQEETFLRQKLEGTKSIDERRKLRAELRTLREKKEKFVDDNNNNQSSTVASKVTMTVGSSKKSEFREKTNRLNRESSPARKENVAPQQPKSTRSTFSFKMANADEASPERPSTDSYSRRHQTNHVKSNIEEKRPRRNQDVNHNRDQLNIVKERNEPIREKKQEPETASSTPQRMSRRASLAELFKIDQDSGSKPQVDGRPTAAPVPQVQVSPSPPTQRRMPAESPQDMKTKQDLLQNLGRLRCRRRSVREIERKEELEGLMYVKSGDSVKLVSTSEGDEQAKEQRRMRRSSRKESHDRLKVEGNTISERSETELTAIEESPRLPTAARNFGFGSVSKSPAQNRYGSPAKRDEPATSNRTWPPTPAKDQGIGGTGRVTKQWPPPSDPAPQRAQPPKPTSFLPQKNDGPKFGRFGDKSGGGGMGSVKDRMAFFRAAAEEEKKAKEKQHVQKRPTAPVNQFNGPAPISRTAPTSQTGPAGQTGPASPTSSTSPKERVSLKKAPDPSKTPRDLKKKPPLKRQMSVSSLILEWCKDVTKEYENVNITNFSGSFSNGLAFCALIHKFNPDKFDYNSLSKENREHNFKLAFETGSSVGIPALLDVEDMIRLSKPEPRSVQCYVQMIFSKYRPKDIDMSNLIIA